MLGAVWTRAMNLGAFFWEHNILVELLQVLPAKDLLCCWHLVRTMQQLRAARAPFSIPQVLSKFSSSVNPQSKCMATTWLAR